MHAERGSGSSPLEDVIKSASRLRSLCGAYPDTPTRHVGLASLGTGQTMSARLPA